MQLAITTHHSLDTSFTVQMKDKPRVFLPGTPEFTRSFLCRGIKFPPASVSDLIWSSCLGRNTQPPGWRSRRVVGDSRQGRGGNINHNHVGSQCHRMWPTRPSNPALHEGKTQLPAEWTPEGLWGLPTSVALFSTLSEEELDEQRPNLGEICRETKSVRCVLTSLTYVLR